MNVIQKLAAAVGVASPPIDPLKRVFVPVENREGYFATTDRRVYRRNQFTGEIRIVVRKTRGKAARRADKRARLLAREMRQR